MGPLASLLAGGRRLASGLARAVSERLFYSPRPWLIAEHNSTVPEFSPLVALSTLSRFPWIWVCVDAISWDLAGLPLIAVKRERTGSIDRPIRKRIVDDPLISLLERPNSGEDGVGLLAQVFADELLTGNGYLWFPDGAGSTAIYRLHPFQTEPIVGFGGLPTAYRVTDRGTGQVKILPAAQVAHFRGLSWRDDERSALGESVIRCLNDDLLGDLGARQQGARLAKKGRPDIMFAVDGQLGPKGADEIRQRWEQAINAWHGAFAYGGKITATPLSWAPKDFGEKERDEVVRNKVLAAFGVPPTRAGLTTASYGASRQEMRVYWERLISRAQRYQRVLSRFARAGTSIEFDFSGVESLQVGNTERMAQAEKLIAAGATPKQAFDYVGFPDAPVPDEQLENFQSTMPIDRQPNEPQDGGRDGDSSGAASADPLRAAVRTAVREHCTAAELAFSAAAESGSDARLLVTFLARQLEHGLVTAGLEAGAARWWSEEVAAISDELVRAGGQSGTPERVERLTTQILTPARAEVQA